MSRPRDLCDLETQWPKAEMPRCSETEGATGLPVKASNII